MQTLNPLEIGLGGRRLIEASAGTGKTYTIATLYLRLLLEPRRLPSQAAGELGAPASRRLGLDRILVVTFTNAATAELRDRLRRRLRQAVSAFQAGRAPADDDVLAGLLAASADPAADALQLQQELRRFDEAAIYTIHGFCQRMLAENAFESGVPFELQLEEDQLGLLTDIAHDFWTTEVSTLGRELAGSVRDSGLTPEHLAALARAALADPDQRILPEADATALAELRDRHDLACAAVARSYGALQRVYEQERETLPGILADPAWKEAINKAENIERHLESLATLCSAGAPPRAVPPIVTTFGPESLATKTRIRRTTPASPVFRACAALEADYLAREELTNALLGALRRRFVEVARVQAAERKQASGAVYYDDLLLGLDRVLRDPGRAELLRAAIAGRFDVALIDEFQDTDPVQYRIFGKLFAAGPGDGVGGVDGGAPARGGAAPAEAGEAAAATGALFLIGDPKQAIYGFRGADIFSYLGAAAEVAGSRYTLGTNWRSDAPLVAAVNQIFSASPQPFVYPEIGFEPVAPRPGAGSRLVAPAPYQTPFEFLLLPCDEGETGPGKSHAKGKAVPQIFDGVAAEIVRSLEAGMRLEGRPVAPGDFAVLVRTHRQGQGIQRALLAAGVPAVQHGSASVFETLEAKELGLVLEGMARSDHAGALRAALSTRLVGVSATTLMALADDERAWDGWVTRFRGWGELWQRRGFQPALGRFMDELEVVPRTLGGPGGERRMTNLLHLAELLQLGSRRLGLGGLELVRWLRLGGQERGSEVVSEREATQLRVESDAEAVQVVTMHHCKGLEYPVVYCPFLWERPGPDAKPFDAVVYHAAAGGRGRVVDVGSAERDASVVMSLHERLAESVRLAYVALTRARHRCCLVWGKLNQLELSGLGYVLHGERSARGELGVSDLAAMQKAIKALDEAAVRDRVEALVAASGGAMGVRELEPATLQWRPPALESSAAAAAALSARVFGGELERFWRTSSFTGLVRGARELSPQAADGQDLDELSGEAAPAAAGAEATPGAGPGDRVRLADFPRGARVGNFFHALLEELDFGAGEAVRRAAVAEKLVRFGLEGEGRQEVVCGALGDVLDTPLDASGLRLGNLGPGDRAVELEFSFPVGDGGQRLLLSKNRLVEAFGRAGGAAGGAAGPVLLADYARALGGLEFSPLRGFLRGFMDLVFRVDGRYFVLDYKTNFLGERAADYAPRRLAEAMVHHHYLLQYHLYVVALQRHLRARLRGYEYAQHFGGVFYLFLRGMSPGGGPGWGVFADRPAERLITALDEVLRAPVPPGEEVAP